MAVIFADAALYAAGNTSGTTPFRPIEGIPPVMESDVQKNDPETPIIATVDYYREGNDFLVKSTAAITGKEAWVKISEFWAEPITAPDGSCPDVSPDQIMLLELKGAVSVSQGGKDPTAAVEKQVVPTETTVTTGDKSAVAIFIGGLDSIRLGPNSSVTIDGYQLVGPFRVTPTDKPIQRRTLRVRMNGDSGIVFCKLGYDPQITQYFDIRSSTGTAVAAAGDFVTVTGKDRFEVGVARGTVRVLDAKGVEAGTLASNKSTGFQFLRIPEAETQLAIMTANSVFLQATIDCIEMINFRIKNLQDRSDHGEDLSSAEKEYLQRLPTISFLRKVTK